MKQTSLRDLKDSNHNRNEFKLLTISNIKQCFIQLSKLSNSNLEFFRTQELCEHFNEPVEWTYDQRLKSQQID